MNTQNNCLTNPMEKKTKKRKEERITFCVYPALAYDTEIKSLFLLRLSINVNQIKRKEKSHKE